MKKLTYLLIVGIIFLGSCASPKTFVDNRGIEFTAEPYGWANMQDKKLDTVVYTVNLGNVIWSVIGVETIILPVWLTGWQIMEPSRLKNEHGK